ncbi:hypothetical protein HY250_01830 [Candidatus Azambacteria bacterium]|nr:hypothetical protein [Candidatus Azambacteria bacterium]MBI3685120.1 hypothetical protein [Candidatus Azambacteria bacterium]
MAYFTREELLELLPFGRDFLFLDSARVLENEYRTVGSYCVRFPEQSVIMESHFPGTPIFPGHLQMEAAAQLAALLMMEKGNGNGNGIGGYMPLMGHSSFDIELFAVSGDGIQIEVELGEKIGKQVTFFGMVSGKGGVSLGVIKGRAIPKGALQRMSKMAKA